jgi:molybdopterin-guanine dinucleotide biosynthesis protein A
MAAIIVAGGDSTRLGRDKALESIGGMPILERVLISAAAFGPAFIVANDPRKYDAFADRAELLADLRPHSGPLGGLLTGLKSSPDERNVLLPCDAPFINPKIIELLLAKQAVADAVVPTTRGRIHTTLAGYSRTCLPAIESAMDSGKLRMVDFFPEVQVAYLDDDILNEVDPEGLCFFNVNTEDDVAEAVRIAESVDGGIK